MGSDAQSIAQMAQHFQPSPFSDDHGDQNGLKRKATDDAAQAGQRSRRNRYVSIACNECKRRKIKCNGETPCQRCGNLSLECVYAPNCCTSFKDSQEYKDMLSQIALLQDQVATLFDAMSRLRAQTASDSTLQHQLQQAVLIDPTLQTANYPQSRGQEYLGYSQAQDEQPSDQTPPVLARPQSEPSTAQPAFRGHTSSDFGFGIAKNSLQAMGITSRQEEDDSILINDDRPPDQTTERQSPQVPRSKQMLKTWHATKDPIWQISEEEALRLCHVYDDEISLITPVLNMEKVISYTKRLYRFMNAAHRSGLMQQGFPGADTIDDEETNILKLVLATALAAEASGPSELSSRLFEYVQPSVDRMLLSKIGLNGIRLLVMTALYEFHRCNDGNSWRIIGLTARLCIELGLHRKEAYDAVTSDAERLDMVMLFWSVFILDRRWSFWTGMPFALQDSDIDPGVPRPEEHSPYMTVMIAYANIGSQVWRYLGNISSAAATTTPIDLDKMSYLDYQTLQWQRNVPIWLTYIHPERDRDKLATAGPAPSRAVQIVRIVLYLRASQMRILIHRPVLHSATSIVQHRDQAQTVVDIAKDAIRVLTHTNQTTEFYRTQQAFFNDFLTSALAVLFLAVSHTPSFFAADVREEFYMALDLVRGLSKNSWVSKRLWNTIRLLKEVGPRLGLPPAETDNTSSKHRLSKDQLDPSRSAAVAMAGLAGHNVDEAALYAGDGEPWSASNNSSSPENMANDLTYLFEAVGGQGQAANVGLDGQEGVYGPTPNAGSMDSIQDLGVGAGEEDLTRILKDLF